ncbi:MAG: protein kinase domain-containing protein [Myxococcota bacterium]
MSERFGKYTIEGVLGRGGMAEALKCRLSGPGGFDKLVVVKRILPHLVSDPDFVQMFLDEARLAANLTHANVVQIFEIGEIDHIPYIAMEYVNGLTLHRLARTTSRSNQGHYGHFARVASGVAEGLHYVHTARDGNGEPLHLIHRDVSPTNIIVSLDGVPKLLDFGVAKANSAGFHTRSGLLKGKPRYMSPEQVDGSTLDARTDLFSLGVCLYEVTVGRSPFYEKGMSEAAMLKLIIAGKFPRPRELVPEYPQELEDIVLWAMAPRREDRCPSADALQARLEAFCASGPNASTRKELAVWVQQAAAYDAANPLPMPAPSTPHAYASARQATPARTNSASDFEIQVEEKEIVTTTRVRMRVMTGLAVLGALALLGLMVLVATRRDPDSGPVATPTTPARPQTTTPPPPPPVDDEVAARTFLEEAEKYAQAQKYPAALELLARVRALQVKDPTTVLRVTSLGNDIERDLALIKARAALAEGDRAAAIASARLALEKDPASEGAAEIMTLARKDQAPRASPPPAKKGARPAAQKEAKVTISSTPPAMLFIDGDAIARTPISLPLTAGAHRVQLQLRGYTPVETEINVVAGRDSSVVIPLVEERAAAEPEKAKPPPEPKPDVRPNVRVLDDEDAKPAVRIIGDEQKPKVRIVDDAKPKVQLLDEPKPKVQVIE